jgi:signal transduction histidine kinase
LLIRRDLSAKVIARLERLRTTMRAQVDGTGSAIEVDGDDEIAEMAQSVAYFARELGLREAAARQAHGDLVNTQQQLVQQEKMAALGTLTAGVAHEINNPVNFADGAVQNLQSEHQSLHAFLRHLAGDDAEPEVLSAIAERFEHLDEMTGTAREGHERIKRIVRDLRQFTRLDQAELKAVPIAEPIQSTVNLVRTRFDRIRFELDLKFNPSIECQPAKLGQVFMNLIINACEAIADTKDGRAGALLIITVPDGKYVAIEIADNGAGMDEATRKRVFEPFFTTKAVGAGTGLGLSIVFGIVSDHKGTISVESSPGAGTRFVLRLPRPQAGA